MEELRWIDRREMNRPILVVALKGLFDAAEAATAGVDLLIAKHDASSSQKLTLNHFLIFKKNDPLFAWEHGREIEWPSNNIWGLNALPATMISFVVWDRTTFTLEDILRVAHRGSSAHGCGDGYNDWSDGRYGSSY